MADPSFALQVALLDRLKEEVVSCKTYDHVPMNTPLPYVTIGSEISSNDDVETQAIVQDQFLVGAFSLAAQIYDRMGIEVLVSTENDKDFENNMVTIRAEERLAFAVYRPEAFVTGELTAA